jgi:hypothetical protein
MHINSFLWLSLITNYHYKININESNCTPQAIRWSRSRHIRLCIFHCADGRRDLLAAASTSVPSALRPGPQEHRHGGRGRPVFAARSHCDLRTVQAQSGLWQ